MQASTLRGDWNYPTRVRIGAGRIAELPDACRSLGIRRPLLVTDVQLATHALVLRVLELLHDERVPARVFCALRPNPVGASVEDGVRAFRANDHDGVIAVGGGSAMDVGKAIAFMRVQTLPWWDFDIRGERWPRAQTQGIAPVIAVPTTSGTGSEAGAAASIVQEATHTKCIVFHPQMLPALVIADPELLAGLPAPLTAATGMDALTHCLEALCARGYHPLADGVALQGLRLIHDWLPTAFRDGGNLTARAHMMSASIMGAAAFQKGLGAIHALSHPVGTLYDAHHGLLNGVIAPYVLVHNRAAIEPQMERLGTALGLRQPGFDAVLDWLLALRAELGIPHTLREAGVPDEHVDTVAHLAAQDSSGAGNALPLNAWSLGELYRSALEGRL